MQRRGCEGREQLTRDDGDGTDKLSVDGTMGTERGGINCRWTTELGYEERTRWERDEGEYPDKMNRTRIYSWRVRREV